MPIEKLLGLNGESSAEPSYEELKAALATSNAIIEGLLNMSPYPIAISRVEDGRFMLVNQRYNKISGYSTDEIIGRTPQELNLYDKHDDRQRVVELLRRYGRLDKFETKFRTKDNRTIHANISARPIEYEGQECLLAVTTYVSRISKAHQAVREAENRYRNILNSITECYYEVDLKGNFTFFNNAVPDLFGYSPSELMGLNYKGYTSPDDAERIYRTFNEIYKGDVPVKFLEYAIQRKDGRWVQMEISVSLLKDAKGNAIGFYGINRDRTEQKKAEEAMRRSEEKYRSILEDMDEGYYETDLKGNITYFNKAMLKIHGYPPEELMGLGYKAYLRPEQAEKNLKIFTDIYTSGHSVRIMDYEIIRKDGSVCYSEISAYPLRNHEGQTVGFWGITRDRTEQVLAERALKKSEEHYRMLVENTSDAIYITQQGRIRFHNRKTVELTGSSTDDLRGMEIYNLVHPDDEAVVEGLKMPRLEAGKSPMLLYFRMINQANKVIWVELSTIGITWEGQSATLNCLRDVTHQKRMETQLIQARKMESIGTLAGGIAHDFNNILASMIGFTELVLEDIEPSSLMAENLEEVLVGGRRAKDLVQQILAFARQSEEKIEPVVVSSIVREALRLIRSSLPATITIQQDIGSDTSVMGNATQIHQIVMNLCTNAAHAMDDSGGTLKVELIDSHVSESGAKERLDLPGGNYLKLAVTDTGCGISPEYLDTIFEPFFTTKEPGEGTGMGLSVVQGIVEKYGGRIVVSSKVRHGTTFSIYLPASKGNTSDDAWPCESQGITNERILLVDDEPGILKMNHQILSRLGYRVTSLKSSPEALALFRKDPKAFDLVLTDMTMPEMTGDQMARELMRIRPDIPVVICTGYSKKINEEMASKIGVKALVYKPIVKNELARTLKSVLDERCRKKLS